MTYENNSNEKSNGRAYVPKKMNEKQIWYTATNDNHWVTGSWLGICTPSFLDPPSYPLFFFFILPANILWGRDQYTVIQTFNSNRTGYRNFRYTKTRYFISETQAQYALNLRIHSYFLGLIRIVSQYVFYKDHQSVTFYLKPE